MNHNPGIMTEVVPGINSGIIFDISGKPVGYKLSENAGFAEWAEVGEAMRRGSRAINFVIGDWFNQGEAKFGDMAWQIIDEWQWGSPSHFANLQSIANSVPPEVRNLNLTHTHHKYVRKFAPDEQRHWLTLAEENEWSSRELAEAIRASQQIAENTPTIQDPETNGHYVDDDPPFNHRPRWDAPDRERTPVDEYEQQANEYAEDANSYNWLDNEPEPAPEPSHRLINQSNNNEWYTPAPYIEAARAVMGSIDTDPASCQFANETIKAATFYTIDDDGLTQPWRGNVWMNPPYGYHEGNRSNQAVWTERLIAQYRQGIARQGICLVNAVPGNSWFAPLWDFPICFPDHRIRFYNETTEAGQPTHSNALVYMGTNVEAFVREFSKFGVVARRIQPDELR